MSGCLNGGLPFHDFYNADLNLEKNLNSNLAQFRRNVENELREVDLFDFMKNYELE